MDDDSAERIAKRYLIVHGESLHNIDALPGRLPCNHERLTLEMRRLILRARDLRTG